MDKEKPVEDVMVNKDVNVQEHMRKNVKNGRELVEEGEAKD